MECRNTKGRDSQPPDLDAEPVAPPGERGCLNVWHAAAAKEELGHFEAACERLLAPKELRDADRFRRITTRNQHVVGRAMARRLLADDSISPQQIQFGIGEHGKPFVAEPMHAQQPFNIAHTDGLVLCGVADKSVELVGVDVEALDRTTSSELAERYFSPPEADYLRSLPQGEQQDCFLRIWTLKEAFIKAIGTGMYTPLNDFAFGNLSADHPTIEFLSDDLRDNRNWHFTCFEPRPGYIASAAMVISEANSHARLRCHRFEPLVTL